MKWTYEITDDGQTMTIKDHKGRQVSEMDNDGSGFRVPDDILRLMYDESRAKGRLNSPKEQIKIVGMMAAGMIEQEPEEEEPG